MAQSMRISAGLTSKARYRSFWARFEAFPSHLLDLCYDECTDLDSKGAVITNGC